MNDEQPRQPVDTAPTDAQEPQSYAPAQNGNDGSAFGGPQIGSVVAQADSVETGEASSTAEAVGTADAADAASITDTAADAAGATGGGAAPAPAAQAETSMGGGESDAASDQVGAEQTGTDAETAGGAPVRSVRDTRLEEVSPNASMEDLLRASEQQYGALKHGEVIEGSVMRVSRDEVLVDIGAKTEGIVPSNEMQSLSEEERAALQVGSPLLVSVVQPENAEGHAVLSVDRARQERSWRDLQRQFEAGEVIQARVTGFNKGGLLVNLEGVRGFVPASQISSLPPGEANKQAELQRMQGQTLHLKIIEINRSRNRLILSERQAMQEQRESMRTRLLQELQPGQVRTGTVTSICDFGAFVDIGGADGLIHLSELSWRRVAHPSEVLKVGDRVEVYVLSVDPQERKIALSLKRTQPEPWSTITENYHLGQIVKGTITQLTSFGAFARLEDGIEGLIHVSELAEGRVAHPRSVVDVGDTLDLKVIRIDPARRRIGLSLKRVNEDAEREATQAAPVPAEGEEPTDTGYTAAPVEQATPPAIEDQEQPQQQSQAATGQPQQPKQPKQPQQSQQAQPQREQRERRDRDRDRDRDRKQDRREDRRERAETGPMTYGDGDQPMGALAAALANYRLTDVPVEEEVETERQVGPTPVQEPVTQEITAPETAQEAPEQAASTYATDVTAAATGTEDMPAEDARSTVEFTDMAAPEITSEILEAQGQPEANVMPEASIPAASQTEAATEAEAESQAAEADGAETEAEAEAPTFEALPVSGAEGQPSTADSGTADTGHAGNVEVQAEPGAEATGEVQASASEETEAEVEGFKVSSNEEDSQYDSSATKLTGEGSEDQPLAEEQQQDQG